MSGNKTQPTDASVPGFLAAIEDDRRREDCRALLALMERREYREYAAGVRR